MRFNEFFFVTDTTTKSPGVYNSSLDGYGEVYGGCKPLFPGIRFICFRKCS